MSHLNPGLISAYNSLTDKHLAGYFSNTRIRRHLQRAGLITRSGRIVPDKEYRHRLTQRQHQRHVRECLAQAIFHKVLEMERAHQTEIKRRLEEFAKRERVHKIKSERSNRYEEDFACILSPCPPTGARVARKQRSAPEGDRSESSESPGSSRPNTAPGKMQRPVRLKPIRGNRTMASLRRGSPYRPPDSSHETDQPLSSTMNSHRRLTGLEASRGISPYCLPVINTFVTPVPPPTKRKDLGLKGLPSGAHRGRRLRPSTLNAAKANEDPPMLRSSVYQSRVSVNMIYFGKKVHLSHDLHDTRDEVKVFQQHCGGENLCVYKGLLHRGEAFQFTSRRHRGYPFSLTFFLNGLQVERLSSCCEFKHRRASRLGGRHRHFGFCSVEGASPCYKCIIAMGLDKQPTPPPKRVLEDRGGQDASIGAKVPLGPKATIREGDVLQESSQLGDVEARVREGTAAVEVKGRDGYEEDFEADDEGPADDADTQEKMSSSPQSQTKETNVSETEDDGNDEDITSHRSSSSSSSSGREESEGETDIDRPKESNHEETDVPAEARAQPNPEETSEAELKDSEVENSAAEGTEINIPDSTGPSGAENEPSPDTSAGTDESKQEEELERAKSVQEKLAEAILKESQYSSEPELSDTSTEDEEDVQKQEHKEEPVTVTVQETKCEAGFGNESPVEVREEMKEKPEEDTGDSKDRAEEPPAEIHPPEEAGNTRLHPRSENKMEEKSSENGEDAVAKDVEQTDEVGQEAKGSVEDESSRSVPNEKAENETAVEGNVEAGGATEAETMEMKVELSEEQEALGCEEAPVAGTEERRQEDGEDRAATPKAEDSNGSGVSEESGAKTGAEANGDAQRDEREDKEEAAEEEEETEQSVQTHDELEEKPEDEDEEKRVDPDEMGDRNSSEERREEDNETKTDSNVGGDEKEQDDPVEGKTDQSPKTNERVDCECVKDGNEEEEKEATDVGEKTSETCEEVKIDETDESRAGHGTEGGEGNAGNGEKDEEGGISNADELGKNTDAGSTEDVKKPEGSAVETEDEAANIEVQETARKASGEETENGGIDAESREISSRAESGAQVDGEEAGTEAQNDAEAAKHTLDTVKADGATDVKDSTESGDDGTETHRREQMDPTAHAGSVKSDVKDEEPVGDGPGTEIKETELEERCHIPEESNEALTKEALTEVTSEQSSALAPLDDTAREFGASIETPEMEEHRLSAVRGESGETEASKASEEGASVVLNPRAVLPEREECPAAHPEITEIIDAEENVDLVSNWVTTHQVAKFFETFVEPLDDLKETQAEETQRDQCVESSVKSTQIVDEVGEEQTKEEAIEGEHESSALKTAETSEKDPVEGKVQVQEETEVMDLLLDESSDKEVPKGAPAGSEGSGTSLQNGKGQEGFAQDNSEQDIASTPGEGDGTGSQRSVARGGSERQTEQEDPGLDTKATPVEEFRGSQAPGETQHHSQRSTPAEEPPRLNGHQPLNAEGLWGANEKGPGASFTRERVSEEPEESTPPPPDTSVGGEGPDVRLIPDLRHSKERLSVPSVTDTSFVRSSYPFLAAVRTQDGQ